MSLEAKVEGLTQQTINLLNAVTVSKSYIDAGAKAAIAGVTVQGAISPTAGKSPVGDANGRFTADWLSGPLRGAGSVIAGETAYGQPQASQSALYYGVTRNSITDVSEAGRFGVGGVPGKAFEGYFSWQVQSGLRSALSAEGYDLILRAYDVYSGQNAPTLLRLRGNGQVCIPLLKAGTDNSEAQYHSILKGTEQDAAIVYIGRELGAPCVVISASNGQAGWGYVSSVILMGKNDVTQRSISSAGTINTSGNDYAEYVLKADSCNNVIAGQIVGLTALDEITDKWQDAVIFSVKSTDPSFVGGDTWAQSAGPKPETKAGPAPTAPSRHGRSIDEVLYTDAEWAQIQLDHLAATQRYSALVEQDTQALAAHAAAVEVLRQRVDRIAIAGRVPVNVRGAKPGDYIVPVADDGAIHGVAIAPETITLTQYMQSIGQVIRILPDGRAFMMVKAV